MSILSSHYVESPNDKIEECAKFEITQAQEQFTFSGITVLGQKYTLSLWIKSDTPGHMRLWYNRESNVDVNTSSDGWEKIVYTFTADSNDIIFDFDTIGTYYCYHFQLESGDLATEWTVAIEDIDAAIKNASNSAHGAQNAANSALDQLIKAETNIQTLEDMISMLVVDQNGQSLMVQNDTGWVFSMASRDEILESIRDNLGSLTEEVEDSSKTISDLNNAVKNMELYDNYVTISLENNQPYIELGEKSSPFKIRITNEEIQFINGVKVAYINQQKLYIEKAEITDELQFGEFVWAKRENGNMGLTWNGGS